MINRIRKKIEPTLRLAKELGFPNAFLFALDVKYHRQRLRKIEIGGFDLFIRSNSSDLQVARSSFCHEEYGEVRLTDPKVIIDGGANIGTSSLYFARKFPNARIFAIEPERSNYDLLKRNAANYPNIIPIKAALTEQNGQIELKSAPSGNWGYTVSETLDNTGQVGETVDCITISSLLSRYKIVSIDLLKLDIEGGEVAVLQDSKDWMPRVKVVTIELHDRLIAGCTEAFRKSTSEFSRFEQNGEKITAYRS